MTSPLLHKWNIATKRCQICDQPAGGNPICPGSASRVQDSPPATPAVPQAPVTVPPDLRPLLPSDETKAADLAMVHDDAERVRAIIEEEAKDAAEVAESVGKVDLQFPSIGFINPVEELEKMRRLSSAMSDFERLAYPEKIRAKLLAWHANQKENSEPSDEELALAIYIKRVSDSPLTAEDLEAKATGKKSKKEGSESKAKGKAKPAQRGLDDILGI